MSDITLLEQEHTLLDNQLQGATSSELLKEDGHIQDQPFTENKSEEEDDEDGDDADDDILFNPQHTSSATTHMQAEMKAIYTSSADLKFSLNSNSTGQQVGSTYTFTHLSSTPTYSGGHFQIPTADHKRLLQDQTYMAQLQGDFRRSSTRTSSRLEDVRSKVNPHHADFVAPVSQQYPYSSTSTTGYYAPPTGYYAPPHRAHGQDPHTDPMHPSFNQSMPCWQPRTHIKVQCLCCTIPSLPCSTNSSSNSSRCNS